MTGGSSGFGSAGRGVTGGVSGFGSAGRSATGDAPPSSDPRSSSGSGFSSPGRHTSGGGFGLRIGGSSSGQAPGTTDRATTPPPPDVDPGSSVRSAPQPLRGSLGRASTASSWASPTKNEPGVVAPPESEEVPKTTEAAREVADSASVEPVPSRRGKAGTMSWGKK